MPVPRQPQEMISGALALDDDALTSLISQLLQSRPEIAPAVIEAACPDLTYVPACALTERRCTGTLKAVNGQTGFASISCPEMAVVFGGDVIVHQKQVGAFAEGSNVSFAVTLNKENMPQAFDLLPVGDSLPPSNGSGMPQNGGVSMPNMASMAQMAACGGMGGAMNPMNAMMAAMGTMSGGMPSLPPTISTGLSDGAGMMGPMAQAMMRSSMGGDARGPPQAGGEPCRFYLSNGWCKYGDQCHFEHVGTPNPDGKKDKPFIDQQIIGEHFGMIKSYNHEKGFGFIACDALKSERGCDVFLGSKHVGEFQVGSEVKFTAYLYNGKLQGKDLQDATGQVGMQEGANKPWKMPKMDIAPTGMTIPPLAPAGGAQEELGSFMGMIKSFNENKGFGFIESPDLKAQGYEMDAFLHKDYLGCFTVGSVVRFSAFVKDSKLRARDLSDPMGGFGGMM